MGLKRKVYQLYKALVAPFEKKVEAKIITLAPNQLLEGRTALVTGATSGIGLSISEAFLNAGASVIIAGRNFSKVNSTIDALLKKTKAEGKIFSVVFDVQNINEHSRAVQEVESFLPKQQIDILVNCAGIGDVSGASEEDEYDKVMDTNLKSVFFLSKVVAKQMIENGIKGNILNIASSSSLRPAGSVYGLSKWGIRGLTSGMAKMLIPYGIVVNGIGPGATATPFMDKKKGDEISNSTIPSGRFVMPEEVANLAVFLTSGMGRMIVGDIVYITGGTGTLTYDDIDYSFK